MDIQELIESSRSSSTLGNTGKVSYHYSINKGGGYLAGSQALTACTRTHMPHVHTRIEHVLHIIKSKHKRKNNCLSCCLHYSRSNIIEIIVIMLRRVPVCSLPSREATSTQDSRSRRSASEFTALLDRFRTHPASWPPGKSLCAQSSLPCSWSQGRQGSARTSFYLMARKQGECEIDFIMYYGRGGLPGVRRHFIST